MQDSSGGWKQFNKLPFDKKRLSHHVKRASSATNKHAHEYFITRFENVRQVRKKILAWLLVVSLLIAAVAVQLAVFRQNYSLDTPGVGGTYAEGSMGPVDTLNPLYAQTPAELTASKLIFSTLYTYDTTGHLIPDSAKTMKISEDGRVYSVTLKDNIRWHDDQKLTAKDVAFTIQLIKNPQSRSPLRVNWRDVQVKAVDDRTVEFTLPAPYAAFPYALNVPILPEHILKNVAAASLRENHFSRSPVGSGPFEFKLLQAADAIHDHKVIHLVSNDSYYAGKPKLNRFEIHAYASEQAILKALRIDEVSGAQLPVMSKTEDMKSKGQKIINKSIDSGVYLILNNTSPTLSDINVRRALQLGTDTGKVRKDIGESLSALDLPFIANQVSGGDIPKPAPTDTKRAGELLDQAGWKLEGKERKKDGKVLELNVTTIKDSQAITAIKNVASQWQDLGIKVNQNIIDPSLPGSNFWQDTLQPRNYDVLLHELLLGADPDVYAYWHSSQIGANGYNFANYNNSVSDAALSSARSRVEPELRSAKYKAFAKQWLEDAPAIGLYQQAIMYVYNPHTQTMDPSQQLVSAVDRLDNVIYWSVNLDTVYKTP